MKDSVVLENLKNGGWAKASIERTFKIKIRIEY